MKIVVVNTKGGSSKSTVAREVCSTYFLTQNKDVKLIEFDDENLDSKNYQKSKIETEQITVDQGDFLASEITKIVAKKNDNVVFDVGGNKSTTLWIDALVRSRMYIGLSLIVIPISSGSQDVINAITTYHKVKDLGVPIIFGLSRCRHDIQKIERIKFQYQSFFTSFPDTPYFILKDSDCIDLSRRIQKTVFEIANDPKIKKEFDKRMSDAYNRGDEDEMIISQDILHIVEESEKFHNLYLKPAFDLISKYDKDK